ncbi:MAG TPA: arginine--tRNA ligase [Lachnospiraceae bacterium]|nr:arginine--tRNA ligase [Lachnospiraceae bacterium]
MNTIISMISEHVSGAFEKAGYDKTYGKVTLSNRPDLCEYQCNGAMAAAKQYKKAPLVIATDVAAYLKEDEVFSEADAAAPGFLNLKISDEFLTDYLGKMRNADKFGLSVKEKGDKVIIDYGGPNVAKPLHVGHLRSAIIGESLKRILRYAGDEVTGDIHLGDWGLQMGLIMAELRRRRPDLPYFDTNFTGDYPAEPPFTLSELEEIYPTASARSKEDEDFKNEAMNDTFMLQKGDKGRTALWQHIMSVSIPDLKRNYEKLNVSFELWKGESDAGPYIDGIVDTVKTKGLAYESEGALVVDVKEETDTKEIPPCMILKSDGAALYTTTDLATLSERRLDFDPDRVLYVADKRQEMHFTQVFRCAKKAGIVSSDTGLGFLGFGTMNGKDGKPFKTREGGVMRLEVLLNDIKEEMYNKIKDNHEVAEDEARATAGIVALAAVKYGDLSNQASKDYIFDTDKFTSFEGNTGPYILYTIVRIKSILNKYAEAGGSVEGLEFNSSLNDTEKALMLELVKFSQAVTSAYEELAPHKICAFIYDVANAFNRFYHENRILGEEDKVKKEGFLALLKVTMEVLETGIDLLGFSSPEKM